MKIVIVGSGAVASHLNTAFKDSADVTMVNPRTLASLPESANLYIIAVKDDAIEEVAMKMQQAGVNGIVCHTSGSTSIDVLKDINSGKEIGVMYPLQTFSRGIVIDYSHIPFFVEGDTESTERTIRQICEVISVNVFSTDSELRRKLHLSAVFANNFVNAMINAADTLLSDTPFDYKVLMPLVKETIRKIEHDSPIHAQTGPAMRNDVKTIEAHHKILKDENHKELDKVYDVMTSYIINNIRPQKK